MDFVELEAVEGLRWSWNSWPTSKSEASALIIPLSVMCTPLMQPAELPIVPCDPLLCSRCGAVLNPYARLDYQSRIWHCPFCSQRNPFPRSYSDIADTNLPAKLFPTYSSVEYAPNNNNNNSFGFGHVPSNSLLSRAVTSSPRLSSSFSSSSSLVSSGGGGDPRAVGPGPGPGPGPALVFVVDVSSAEDELRALKKELLLVMEQLPENTLVGLVTFDSMVYVHDLGYSECSKIVVFHGDREFPSNQVLWCPLV